MAEITNAIIEFFQNAFNNNSILTILFISIFPIIELRGAIPVAVKLQMPWYEGLFYSWLGSSLIVPILLLLLMPILNAMKRSRWFKSLAHTIEGEFKGKADKIQTKADAEASAHKSLAKKMLGVFAFVALPLPLTGVWTGSAVAVFLGLKFWQALPVILVGNLMAGAIMAVLSYCFSAYVDTILAVFFVLIIVLVLFYIVKIVVKIRKNKKNNATADSTENAVLDETEANNNTTITFEVDKSEDSIVDIDNKTHDDSQDKSFSEDNETEDSNDDSTK